MHTVWDSMCSHLLLLYLSMQCLSLNSAWLWEVLVIKAVTLLSHTYNIWRMKVVWRPMQQCYKKCMVLVGYNWKYCVCGRCCINISFLPNGTVWVQKMHLTVCDYYIISDDFFIVKLILLTITISKFSNLIGHQQPWFEP